MVLSEFINTIARHRYNAIPNHLKPPYKTYRNSSAFRPIAKDIIQACRRISKACISIDVDFPSYDVEALYRKFEEGRADFNDLVLAELCKRKNLKFVTDDGDFRGEGITILTENNRLLH